MRIFETFDIEEILTNPVVTVGNYDGIHLGHRRIIERVRERAWEIQGTSVLITFHPHPLHVLRPEKELAAITPLEERKGLIEETGVDALFLVPFTKELSRIPAEDFVRSILVQKLAMKGIVIGYDFRFGRDGKGDLALLKSMGHEYGFFVEEVGEMALEDEKIGSNRIRKLVVNGEVAMAARVLGRPYAMEGTVIRAKGRGRTIGYPTINLKTDYALIPKNGVYVTEVEIEGQRFGAVTNVGVNPTFEAGQERSIESFILDFHDDLYGKKVRVIFLERIRDEVRFSGIDELIARIGTDVEAAREYFLSRGTQDVRAARTHQVKDGH
jgi:riboflavin kinase / FMN adenylyltransferase